VAEGLLSPFDCRVSPSKQCALAGRSMLPPFLRAIATAHPIRENHTMVQLSAIPAHRTIPAWYEGAI